MKIEKEFTTTAFDSVAASYDLDFTFSNIGRLQRKRVYYFLEKFLPKNKSLEILEINCGTGEDALWLAKKKHHVIATDASEKMIAIATEKCNFNNSQQQQDIIFQICSFDTLKNQYSTKKFDFIFSNFGGLNCINEDQLRKLSVDLSFLLKPSGKFVAVIMGRMCLWELFYFAISFKFKKALRRFSKNGIDTELNYQIQKTYYYSPSELKKNFNKEFQITIKKPVGIALPPSYLEPFFKTKILFLKLLNLIEKFFSFSLLSNFADHYFIVSCKRTKKK